MMRSVFAWCSAGCALASALAAFVDAWLALGVWETAVMIALPFFILPALTVMFSYRGPRWIWIPMALVAGVEAVLVPGFWPFVVVPVLACLAVGFGVPLLLLPRESASRPRAATD